MTVREGGRSCDECVVKAPECKKMGKEASNSLIQSTTQRRLPGHRKWCSSGCQPTCKGDGLDG